MPVKFPSVWRRACCGPLIGIVDLDAIDAREHVRARVPDANAEDLRLLDDLLGIAEPGVILAAIDPDARRRRLTALINAVFLARTAPAIFVIEDAHWIDEVSESMLAEFLAVDPADAVAGAVTYRPGYQGALTRVHGAQTISLAPIERFGDVALLDELLGPDLSVGELGAMIVGRAAGNPFFAEEMVRELADRGVLDGDLATTDAPPTSQR